MIKTPPDNQKTPESLEYFPMTKRFSNNQSISNNHNTLE